MSDTPKVGADRAGIMERYHEAVGLPKVDSEVTPAPAEAEASSDSANNQSQSDAQPSKEPTDKAPQQPIAKEVVNDPGVKKDVEKPEDTKMVPLGALHEAREKYKAKNLEARQLSEQLSAKDQVISDLQARLSSVEDTIKKAQAGESDVPADDEKTLRLAEENKKLKEAQAKADEEKTQRAAADEATKWKGLIDQTHESLTKEGYPGFGRFVRDVYDALKVKVDSGELELNDITPAMWAEVYKTDVYPKVKEIFASQLKQEKKDAKTQQKKSANLVNNPGEGPAPKEDDNLDAPQTSESYMKARKRIF
jgi:hypothetical protein